MSYWQFLLGWFGAFVSFAEHGNVPGMGGGGGGGSSFNYVDEAAVNNYIDEAATTNYVTET
jgi:hypothetical protein